MSLEKLLASAPDFVLHMFACNCAERALWYHRSLTSQARHSGHHKDSWERLATKRRWMGGDATEEERRAAEAHARAQYTSSLEAVATSHRATQQAVWGALSKQPRAAASVASRAALRIAPKSEERWQIERLQWLTETFGWAGYRMNFLLEQGEIDTPDHLAIRPW